MVPVIFVLGILAAIVSQYFNKKLLARHKASVVVNTMYIWSALLVTMIAFFFTQSVPVLLPVFLIGAFNAIGAWFFARGVHLSLSKTILFLPFINGLAVGLSALFLGEWAFFDFRTAPGALVWVGVLATLGAITLFYKKSSTDRSQEQKDWLFALVGFVLVVGVINFLVNFFAVKGIPLITYVTSWYIGGCAGSFVPRIVERDWSLMRGKKVYAHSVLLSLCIVGSLSSVYYALLVYPATVLYPLQAFFYTLGAVMVGLYIFREARQVRKRDVIGMVVGGVGAICLLLGYYLQ
ncbi:MAG: hypothetical protein COU35_03850 [Candidatus Magasanikbacteria bacterium CG10_big_fil_rev_8_21_14_0_10_47_10]|uniref:EamA domain-containing protein n=1 Tax=Candidatus Magasanikbacteria bacterium CG10_big_fil_rev_8_21_14_0_10_47_10 TaxID=1974652 RepID=A0A2H0TPU9_9BACT|nr:MAG: hypothetical protein COU35_03850 [Candidatus Magasanikbacteria bacterium CG10_big_fil_rev_8_21_14_0_10_47_10]